ncbi:MAG TPA: BON domain-containing protein [Steroidobacteraceae bacterium]|nr:BON domain-containing protein [Steroidobacteraceae bacterium]
MAQNYRNSSHERGGRPMRSGPDRDPFRSGDERRYTPDRGNRERAFRGDRSYATGGYSEEQGYRREGRDDWNRDTRNQRDESYWRQSSQDRAPQYGRDQWSARDRDYNREQERYGSDEQRNRRYGGDYSRGQFRGQQTRGYGEFGSDDMGSADFARGWSNLDTPAYYGTGNHAGIVSSGAGTRASEDGLFGPSTTSGGQSSWDEPNSDWVPESSARRGTDTDYSRGTTGEYSNYGRSEYGAQSSYGRSYGEDDRGGAWQQEWRGSHRGRGPKGYARSDERLREMICERLTDDPRIDASEIDVEVHEQTVKLTGSVPNRQTKYEVEDLVEHCGAKDIDNQLRVQSRWGSQSGASQSGFRNTVQSKSDTQDSGSRYDYSGGSTDAQSGSSQLASAAGRSSSANTGSAATSTSSTGPSPNETGASASGPGTSPGASKRDNRSS